MNKIFFLIVILTSCTNHPDPKVKLSAYLFCKDWIEEEFIFEDSITYAQYPISDLKYFEEFDAWEFNSYAYYHKGGDSTKYNVICRAELIAELDEYPYNVWKNLGVKVSRRDSLNMKTNNP